MLRHGVTVTQNKYRTQIGDTSIGKVERSFDVPCDLIKTDTNNLVVLLYEVGALCVYVCAVHGTEGRW